MNSPAAPFVNQLPGAYSSGNAFAVQHVPYIQEFLMTFDPNSIAPQAKDRLIALGRTLSSSDTLAQAELTQNAYAQHGPALADHGYSPGDAAELATCRLALIDAMADREESRAGKKTTNVHYWSTLNSAKNMRTRARSILRNTSAFLSKQPGSAEQEALGVIEGVLKRVAEPPKEPHALANQLELCVGVLKSTTVAGAAKERGGEGLLLELEKVIPGLRGIAQADAVPKGTQVETEVLDLLDGLIVENCRAARRAARSAGRALGMDSIPKAFELSAVYRRRGKKGENENPAPSIK